MDWSDPLIYLIPVISALIGWFTNFMAVKMIFRPHKPINILGVKIHGLIPRRQSDMAVSIGETVEKELISHDDIQAAVESPDVQERIVGHIQGEVDKFMQEKLATLPMVGMFLQGEMATNIKGMLIDQLREGLPSLTEEVLKGLESKIDFKELVRQKIEAFNLDQFEAIIYRIASQELKLIEVFGGVLGFLVGVGQVALIYLLGPGA